MKSDVFSAAVLSSECLVIVAKTFMDDIEKTNSRRNKFSLDLCYRLREKYRGPIYGAWGVLGKDGFLSNDLEKLKTKDPKIVILGDSYDFSNGLPVQATFAEQLDRMLGHASVINLSGP